MSGRITDSGLLDLWVIHDFHNVYNEYTSAFTIQ